MTALRWVLLLAAVHSQPGGIILLVIVAGLLAEQARRRWSPWGVIG